MSPHSSQLFASSSICSTPLRVPAEVQSIPDFAEQVKWVVSYRKGDVRRYLPQKLGSEEICHLCAHFKNTNATGKSLSHKNRHIRSRAHIANMCAELNLDPTTFRPDAVVCPDCGTTFSGARTDALHRHKRDSCRMRPDAPCSSIKKAPVARSTSLPSNNTYASYETSSTSTSPASSPLSFDGKMRLSAGHASCNHSARPSWESQNPGCAGVAYPNLEREIIETLSRPIPGIPGPQYNIFVQHPVYTISSQTMHVYAPSQAHNHYHH